MGPIFSGIVVLVLGGIVSLAVFGIALIVNNKSPRPRSKTKLVLLAVSTSASFWTGAALCGLAVGWLLSDHGMLQSSTAVFDFFGMSFVGGLIAGTLAGRLSWRLTESL